MTDRIPLAQHTKASLDQLYDDLDQARTLADPELHARLTAAITALGKSETELKTARDTNRRLNLRAQQLESELTAYRRAVDQWEVSDRGTYVPLRTIAAIAKAAGRDIEHPRWLLHYQRVEQAEAANTRVRALATRIRQGAAPWTANDDDIADHIVAALDGDQTPAARPVICELPHQTVAEEDACEQQRLAALDAPAKDRP